MVKNLLYENPTNRVLSLDGLSQYTGYSKAYIYRLSTQGKIPGASKPGNGKLFFDREIIDDWLLSNPITKQDKKSTTV